MGDRDYLLLAAGMNLLTWGWAADLVGLPRVAGYILAGGAMAAAAGGRAAPWTDLVNFPGNAVVCAMKNRELQESSEEPIP